MKGWRGHGGYKGCTGNTHCLRCFENESPLLFSAEGFRAGLEAVCNKIGVNAYSIHDNNNCLWMHRVPDNGGSGAPDGEWAVRDGEWTVYRRAADDAGEDLDTPIRSPNSTALQYGDRVKNETSGECGKVVGVDEHGNPQILVEGANAPTRCDRHHAWQKLPTWGTRPGSRPCEWESAVWCLRLPDEESPCKKFDDKFIEAMYFFCIKAGAQGISVHEDKNCIWVYREPENGKLWTIADKSWDFYYIPAEALREVNE